MKHYPFLDKWNHAFNENGEIKSILEYFADKGCLGFLSSIGVSDALQDFSLVFKHEDERVALSYYGENLYTITDLTYKGEYFRPKALSVMSDIVIDRMVDDVRQKLSVKFDGEISDDLKGVWNVFLSFLHDAFIHQLQQDFYYSYYNDEDKCIELTLFKERVCIAIYDNGSILVETSEDDSFTGGAGEYGFTKQLNEALTHFSNLD